MNPQSKILVAFGVFVSAATCSGQQPMCKKSMMGFAAEIIKVDSILSASSYFKEEISSHDSESEKDSIRLILTGNRIKQKRGIVCPGTIQKGPKKI